MNPHPNVVILFPDQMRADFLGCYGSQLPTRHIDELARESQLFTTAISAHPICVPARTALLTGMSGFATGVLTNAHSLRPDYRAAGLSTWPELLARHGYHTSAVGKMHFYPWDATRGFQHRVIAEDKRWLQVRDDYYKYLRTRGLTRYHGRDCADYEKTQGAIVSPFSWEDSVDHFVGSAACNFIEASGQDQPFALMVGFPGPHCPYDPDERFLDLVDDSMLPPIIEDGGHTPGVRARLVENYKKPWNGVDYEMFPHENKLRIRRHYAASVLQLDHEVGRIVASLKKAGLWDNTVVALASDHGDYLGDHELIGKASFYESAIRIPLVLRVPGLPPAVHHDLVELRDLTPTVLRLAQADVPSFMDARPLPLGGSPARDTIVGGSVEGWMVRTASWKLMYYRDGEECLFNLDADPHELVNRITDPTCFEIRHKLDSALRQEIARGFAVAMQDRLAAPPGTESDLQFGYQGWCWDFPRPVTGSPVQPTVFDRSR